MNEQIKPGTPVRLRASGLSGIVREIVKGGYRVEIPSAAPLPGGLPHTAIVAADELEVQATASEAHRVASARLGPALHLDAIRALLDIHMGRGTSKAALHAHILAYEHLVPALLSGLAAAQAAPVVEWRPDSHGWEVARVGSFVLKLQTGSKCAGWRLFLGDARVTDGPETGPAGKAACEAAYRRACGLPAIPPCAG